MQNKTPSTKTPWFILMGMPGSGKTTLINTLNNNLAVIEKTTFLPRKIDDCGDRYLWHNNSLAILETRNLSNLTVTLKKFLKRHNIRGIITTIDAHKISGATSAQLEGYGKIIKNLSNNFYKELKFRIPIYILLTKTDLTPGFTRFFQRLNTTEAAKAWGIDLKELGPDTVAQNKHPLAHIDYFYINTQQERLRRMQQANKLHDKLLAYNFPVNFYNLLAKTKKLLTIVLNHSTDQETPNLAGIYFTSSQQAEENLQSRSYFIKDFFSKVILENHERKKTRKQQRLHSLYKAITTLSCSIILIAAIVLYNSALKQNKKIVEQTSRLTQDLRSNGSLATLQETLLLDNKLATKIDIPFCKRLGIYQGDKLHKAIRILLLGNIHEIFIKPLREYLTKRLDFYNHVWKKKTTKSKQKIRGDYYTALQTYLLLCYPSMLTPKRDSYIFDIYWNKLLAGHEALANKSKDLIYHYLPLLTSLPVDKQLVKTARNNLQQTAGAKNMYSELLKILSIQLPPLTLPSIFSSNYTLPGIYLKTNWINQVKPAIDSLSKISGSDWVINTPLDELAYYKSNEHNSKAIRLKKQLYKLYFSHYKNAWLQLLKSIKIRPFQSLTDGYNKLKSLTKLDSPLAEFWNTLLSNINIQRLHKTYLTLEPINQEVLSAYSKSLAKIQNTLENLMLNPNTETASTKYTASLFSASASQTSLYKGMVAANIVAHKVSNPNFSKIILHFFLQPVRQTWKTVLQVTTKNISTMWRQQVINYYQANIANGFPFDRTAPEDIPLSALTRFLEPQKGLLWQFTKQRLQPFLLDYSPSLTPKKWLNLGLPFSQKALKQLNRWKIATNNLFDNGKDPSFSYQLYTIPNPRLLTIIFTTSGQKYIYHNGPQEWRIFGWPGTNLDQSSYLAVTTTTNNISHSIQATGPWGVFHLINRARMVMQTWHTYKVVWSLKISHKYYHVGFLLRPSGRYNIFKQILYDKIELPLDLFQ